jgi:hypothetical protein
VPQQSCFTLADYSRITALTSAHPTELVASS